MNADADKILNSLDIPASATQQLGQAVPSLFSRWLQLQEL